MNDEKEKYANGKSISIDTLSSEEKTKAIEHWAEGNEQLKKLLQYCNLNKIGTIACCAGHGEEHERGKANKAYIALELGKKSDDRVLDLLTKVEEKNINMKIGFIRGSTGKEFCVLQSREYGKNEDFFAQINVASTELEENMPVDDEIRKKYEMIRVLLLDPRAAVNNESTEYRFYMGDEQIEALGFFKYNYSLVRIPFEDIKKMGECLVNTPGSDIPKEFYKHEIEEIKLPGYTLKQIAERSKQSIEKIKRAFDSIRQMIFKEKNQDKTKEMERY